MISDYCGQKIVLGSISKRNPIKSLMGNRKWDTFVSNEELNWICFHSNKFFYILVLLLSCLMSTKFHMILVSDVWITWDLNILKYIQVLLVTKQFLLKGSKGTLNAQFSFSHLSSRFLRLWKLISLEWKQIPTNCKKPSSWVLMFFYISQ